VAQESAKAEVLYQQIFPLRAAENLFLNNLNSKYYCTAFVEHPLKKPQLSFKNATSRVGIIFESH